jgi:tRNA G37 N-methylase TrmD
MSGNITWDMGDDTVLGDLHPVHTYTMPGMYTVTLTTAAGACEEQAVAQVVVQAATGIRSLEANNHRVWSDGAHFVVDHEFTGGQVLHVEVLDATGKLHVQQAYSDGPGRVLVPASSLPNGVWFVRLTHNGVQHTQRVPLMR